MAALVCLLPSIRPQMASLTPALLIFQCALCVHHLEKCSRVGGKKEKKRKMVSRKGAFRRDVSLNRCQNSPNNRFPDTSSGEVGCRCSPAAHQQRVNETSCQYRMFEISDTRSPLPYPSLVNAILPLHTPLRIFTRLSFPPPPSAPPVLPSVCREARVKFTTTVKVRDDR